MNTEQQKPGSDDFDSISKWIDESNVDPVSITPEIKAASEAEALVLLQNQNNLLKARTNDSNSTRKLKKKYSNNIYWYSVIWSGFVGVIVVLQGCESIPFYIDSTPFGILLGSTAVSAIGLALAIINGLFK